VRFSKTPLNGAWLIEPERNADVRGGFFRTFCQDEYAAVGLDTQINQCSVSVNTRAGTLRGLHFQAEPQPETKVVRVQRGAIWDAIVDLRKESPSYAAWFGVELSADNARSLYVPKGFAHGFITLVDDTEVHYQISTAYVAAAARGIRWNDPTIGITWPREPAVMSERDGALPLLSEVTL
jgi:dTDP-4-dehydrorhamnose 3,5-epimerase